ncbi:MAG TPA: histidine phosphatase family protein [Candidatus Nanopelagicales bacterium]|nr:histidine phosphatase family protein [Candidatus Nanopelagicales bacterium]
MNRLVVLRHAKSAYPPGVVDHDRPLNQRGVVDAKAAGEWIRANVGVPDHVVVSTARRARGTWTLAAGALGYIGAAGYDADSPGPLTVDPRIYEAGARTLLTVVSELPARVATAVIVGHMPGVEMLVDLLARDREPAAAALLARKYPTAGVAVLETESAWSDLAPGSAYLSAFAVPRGVEPA